MKGFFTAFFPQPLALRNSLDMIYLGIVLYLYPMYFCIVYSISKMDMSAKQKLNVSNKVMVSWKNHSKMRKTLVFLSSNHPIFKPNFTQTVKWNFLLIFIKQLSYDKKKLETWKLFLVRLALLLPQKQLFKSKQIEMFFIFKHSNRQTKFYTSIFLWTNGPKNSGSMKMFLWLHLSHFYLKNRFWKTSEF